MVLVIVCLCACCNNDKYHGQSVVNFSRIKEMLCSATIIWLFEIVLMSFVPVYVIVHQFDRYEVQSPVSR